MNGVGLRLGLWLGPSAYIEHDVLNKRKDNDTGSDIKIVNSDAFCHQF